MTRYSKKVILAPMVRVGALPMRLLALDYGADIVYSEEIIDHRLIKCRRVENSILGTIDFIDEDQNVIFRTCEKERDRVVLQLGTCCPERALKAAKMVEKDVSGIDVNMGCPKEFSLKGGMGAALLTQPEKVKAILTCLTNELLCPVTCKMRVLPQVEDTVSLAKLMENTGIAAVAVHGRTKEERPRHKNRNYVIQAISEALSIPVIANGGSGEINSYEDIEIFRQNTKASSVMLARQAEHNCSIFRKEGKLPLDEVIVAYIKYAVDYDNNVWNTKYCIQQMLGSLQESDRGKMLLGAQQMEVICGLWNLSEYFSEKQRRMKFSTEKLQRLKERDLELQASLKRRRVSEEGIHELDIKFLRNLFSMDGLPKTVLWNWALSNKHKSPFYKTIQYEKSFQSVVTVNGNKYSNRCLEKNKKYSEQAAALVACIMMGLISDVPTSSEVDKQAYNKLNGNVMPETNSLKENMNSRKVPLKTIDKLQLENIHNATKHSDGCAKSNESSR